MPARMLAPADQQAALFVYVAQAPGAAADVAMRPRRVAEYQRVRRHVARYYGAGPHQRERADGDPAHDHRARAD